MNTRYTKVLGVDPGLATTGFAFVDFSGSKPVVLDLGVIVTEKNLSLADRLLEISNEFEELIKKHNPQVVAIEKLVFVQNVTSGIAVAHARGVLISIAAKHNIHVEEIFPKDVKLSICGFGNAPKIQVQNMVQRIFNLKKIPKPDDAADALAVAYSISK